MRRPLDEGLRPFQSWHIDYLQLPTTERGYREVLLAADYKSGFLQAFPTNSRSTKHVLRSLYF